MTTGGEAAVIVVKDRNMSTISDPPPAINRAMKCLARALDPATLDGEATTSATMFIRLLRAAQVTLPDLLRALPAPAHHIMPEPPEPDECGYECWFGKYKGRTFGEIARRDPRYVRWALQNFEDEDTLSILRVVAEHFRIREAA
jgi:hypothetical protein